MTETQEDRKEILQAGQRLENGLGRLSERIDELEESLTQVLRPGDGEGKASAREKQNTPLGDRLYVLAAQLQDENDRLSSIIRRLEV